ncbi:hypothetical protein [Serratia marcescens]|uniref:hypothetical protein n=1 Tax=Serratia marcescens TaxID=615 RepID=UPI001BD67132|nr:hypothetical protein [Serratia marcescens]CAI1996707.1 Uncharacterised protein [Serratia marcescens]CAJ1000111.1 hypothetical protein NVIRSERR_04474 [Serratia marcescens]
MMDETNRFEIIEKKSFDGLNDSEDKRREPRDASLLKDMESKLHRVSPELFAKFLDSKGASRVCLSCGSDKLSVPEVRVINNEQFPENFSQLSAEEQMELQMKSVVSYVSYSYIEEESMPRLGNVRYRVNCNNCGFISFYRAYQAVQWVLGLEEKTLDE